MSTINEPNTPTARPIYRIATLLLKEHLREPSSLLWTAIAPSLLYFLMAPASAESENVRPYLSYAAWFYAYLSANVALFGFSFYLIGRRESGFVRSFIYKRASIHLFLSAHLLSYTALGMIYATAFYLMTKPLHGGYAYQEYLHILICFLASYMGFICLGLIIVALPIRFGTASTLFSLLSFLMLISSYRGASADHGQAGLLALVNPLQLSTLLFLNHNPPLQAFLLIAPCALLAFYLIVKYFRIQPVWSRY